MCVAFGKWISVGLFCVAVATAFPALAWQGPDALPQAPRVSDDAPAPVVITNETSPESEVDAIVPEVRLAPRVPAPAIVPVEEVIAKPTRIEPTIADTPSVSTPVEAETVAVEPESSTPQPLAGIKATSFQGIEPGVTKFSELPAAWGKPKSTVEHGPGQVHTFAMEPFSRVELHTFKDIVRTIVVHFHPPASPNETIKSLSLENLKPVKLAAGNGKAVGELYPERGLSLIYDIDAADQKVTQLQLQPITASAFLLRVHADRQEQWTNNLADLATAAALAPGDGRVAWLKAEILTRQSEYRQAAIAIEQALATQPESPLYHLAAANLIAKAGNYDDAIAATTSVYQREDLPALIKARAAQQLGDLHAEAPEHDFAKAFQLHQASIKIVLPLASDEDSNTRYAAKRLLVDSHAAVAGDIAQGKWQNKGQAVQQWMGRADALADDLIASEGGSPSVKLELLCKRLEAYTWLEGKIDPVNELAQLQDLAEQLRGSQADPTFVRHVKWRYAKAMVDALDIERARGNPLKGAESGELGERTLASLTEKSWQAEQTQFQLARLHFLLGAMQAVQFEDHTAAVEWFDKSLEKISSPQPDQDPAISGRRGQWMISMGISYWHVDRKTEALKLTELGVRLIEAARTAGQVDEQALVVPYNNLAVMHRSLGNDEDAARFSELESKAKQSQQR